MTTSGTKTKTTTKQTKKKDAVILIEVTPYMLKRMEEFAKSADISLQDVAKFALWNLLR